MAIGNTWWFQQFNVYISLLKVNWNFAKRRKAANELRAQARRKSRPVLAADNHTPFGTVGYSRELSTELNIAALSSLLCFGEASECRCSSALGKNPKHLTNLNMLPQREDYLLLMILLMLFSSTD